MQKTKINDYSLYLVLSQEYALNKSVVEIAKEAISGGIDAIQMREKNKTKQELIKLGHKIAGLCKENNIIFIVNDDPFIAKEVNADGVHLGQEDIKRYPVNETRQIIGKDKIIGVSTHSLEQFRDANNQDIDYIAFGPIFPTQTKDYFIGTKDIKKVLALAEKPVVFIGGINISNVDEVLYHGAKNIALIRAIMQADDITKETIEFKKKINRRQMIIKINGKDEIVNEGINIEDLVSKKNLCQDRIVVEHNFQIVPKENWPEINLSDNDNLEIVSFVAGG